MRRFVTLAILLLFTVPFGVSISGCSKKSPTIFCNGGDSGIPVGQVTNIDLEPKITGISLNFAQIGQVSTPSATDCKPSKSETGNSTLRVTRQTAFVSRSHKVNCLCSASKGSASKYRA